MEKPLKIALLNGEPETSELMIRVLQEAGYSVVLAEKSLPVTHFISRESPDILVLDLQTQDMSGLTLLDILHAKNIPIPILLVTTPELVSDNLAQQGVAGVLIKPVDPERLIMHVRAISTIQHSVKPEAQELTPKVPPAAPPSPEEAAQDFSGDAVPIAPARRRPEPSSDESSSGEKPPPAPLVLIVDDEPDLRSLLSDLLTFNGFDVLLAEDGMQGLQIAQQRQPDVILLDIMLPKLDGFQICRLLKFNEKFRDIPIIMLTARNHPKDRELADSSGADGYIVKPFETKALVNEIRRVIDASTAERARMLPGE
jgi:DNA-binding response OmpR family regulator